MDSTPNLKNEELIKHETIENTPFTIITVEGKSFGALGKYRITEGFDTADKVKKELDIKNLTWNRIAQIILILNNSKIDINNIVKEEKL